MNNVYRQMDVIFPEDYTPHSNKKNDDQNEFYQELTGFMNSGSKTMCLDFADWIKQIGHGSLCDQMTAVTSEFRKYIKKYDMPIVICNRGSMVYFKKGR